MQAKGIDHTLATLNSFSLGERATVDRQPAQGEHCADCYPKVLALPRGDSAICFAGDTLYAYPILLQAVAAVSLNIRSCSAEE